MTETQRSMMQRSADGCYRKAAELDRQAHALELEAAEYRRSAECLEETIARAQEAGNFRLTEKGEDHGGTTEVRQS